MSRAYEYRHVVPFEETNLLGNVTFTHFVRWQGLCREAFLREHAPDMIERFAGGFRLVTLRCSCEYLAEVKAFDLVLVRMRLSGMVQNRMTLAFEYVTGAGAAVARGSQEIAAMTLEEGGRLVPAAWAESLLAALLPYA